MGSGIITPGQGRGVNGAEALQMIIQQLNAFAMEINLINIRMQVFQNLIVAKNLVTVGELEAEWNKLMEEARSLAMKAKLVDPDGRTINSQPASKPAQAAIKAAEDQAAQDAEVMTEKLEAVAGGDKTPPEEGHA